MTTSKRQAPAPYRRISATPSGALVFYEADVQPDDQTPDADVASRCPECGTTGIVDLAANGAIGTCISCSAVICLIPRESARHSPNVLSNQIIQALARAVLAERQVSGQLRDENEFLRARPVDVDVITS